MEKLRVHTYKSIQYLPSVPLMASSTTRDIGDYFDDDGKSAVVPGRVEPAISLVTARKTADFIDLLTTNEDSFRPIASNNMFKDRRPCYLNSR